MSGLKQIYYRWDSNTNVSTTTCGGAGATALNAGSGSFTLGQTTSYTVPPSSISLPPTPGSHQLFICIVDQAGNIVAAGSGANTYLYDRTTTLPTSPIASNSATPSLGSTVSYVTGNSSLVVAGTTLDSDIGQTLSVQYQIDNTVGTWYSLTPTLTSTGNSQPYSYTVNISTHYPSLTQGSHTLYLRVYDGYTYSLMKSLLFTLDTTAPSNNGIIVGGVKCNGVGYTDLYCTPPTSITLSSTDANQGLASVSSSLVSHYRTQWSTSFTKEASAPSWVNWNPVGSLSQSLTLSPSQLTPASTHTLYYQTKDALGNYSPVSSLSYYLNSPPTLTLDDATHDHIITPYTPLVFTGLFTDLDLNQTVTITTTIGGIDYQSQTYTTLGGEMAWSLVIPAANIPSLSSLSPSQLTHLPFTITDSASPSSPSSPPVYYTGSISYSTVSSEIYLSVIRNIPFSLTLGKVGSLNLSYGTTNGITVSQSPSNEIVVSGLITTPTRLSFGATTLVFTVLDEPSFDMQGVEFV
jgi:hypothetical protein